jgi:hypothetical protein
MYWRLLGVCKTSIVGLSPVDNHMSSTVWVRLSVRHARMGSSLLCKYTVQQHRDGGVQHGRAIAQNTTWVTTRECDKDSDIGDDYK